MPHRLPQDGLELRGRRLSRIAQIDFVVPPVECQIMFWHVFGMKVVEFGASSSYEPTWRSCRDRPSSYRSNRIFDRAGSCFLAVVAAAASAAMAFVIHVGTSQGPKKETHRCSSPSLLGRPATPLRAAVAAAARDLR